MLTGKRKWTYTLADIAVATGQSIFTVRRDQRLNAFNPDDLQSLSSYIAAASLSAAASASRAGRGSAATAKSRESTANTSSSNSTDGAEAA